MKVSLLTPIAALVVALPAATLFAQQRATLQPSAVVPTTLAYDAYYAQDEKEASPSDQPAPVAASDNSGTTATCNNGCTSGCDACCESGHSWSLLGCGDCCNLGDPWKLFPEGCVGCNTNVGGWFQFGYHDAGDGLFNNHPHRVNLHQAWLFAERVAEGGDCSCDWGYRFDVMYGVDAQDTQAFGNNPGEWDYQNGFDHGIYAWALPQAYVDVAYGNWLFRVGHFYTYQGYEVVQAPNNFFYSHAMTFYLTEPFTHTGAVARYNMSDDVYLLGGWTVGWDTGFDQFDQGNNFIGGFGFPIMEDLKFSYVLTAGNLGKRGDDAYTHTVLFDWTMTERLQYVLQSDLLRVDDTGEDNFSLVQYLFYTVNDCVKVGGRVEWWRGDDVTGFTFADFDGNPRTNISPAAAQSYYEATFGVNIKPNANLVFRPEIRQDWAPFADYDETIFGVDVIALW
jgi:hypothetical protein